MPSFQLVKSMSRALTEAEGAAILEWWEENPDMPIEGVVDRFTSELGIAITKTAVVMLVAGQVLEEDICEQ